MKNSFNNFQTVISRRSIIIEEEDENLVPDKVFSATMAYEPQKNSLLQYSEEIQ